MNDKTFIRQPRTKILTSNARCITRKPEDESGKQETIWKPGNQDEGIRKIGKQEGTDSWFAALRHRELLCMPYVWISSSFPAFLIFTLFLVSWLPNFFLLLFFSSFLASRFLLSRFPFPALLMDDGF
jgi:hypothetical protein